MLHLDDVGAVVSEDRRRERPGEQRGRVDDHEAGQRPRGCGSAPGSRRSLLRTLWICPFSIHGMGLLDVCSAWDKCLECHQTGTHAPGLPKLLKQRYCVRNKPTVAVAPQKGTPPR
ncbi:hypothetical protein Ssi03_41040 [Sphaerisporangium siamense]|nr:hypothetical protein Ssi03_41040 [Sphaerisporangium siamense]